MDSTRSNEEWSASEINIVRSLITRYNGNNSYINDINKKHSDIVNEVQEMFPWKEKHQVVRLYVDLVEEMVRSNTGGGSQHSTVVSRDHVSNNTKTPVGHHSMENMDMGLGHPTMETRPVRVVHEVPRRHTTPRTERSHPRFWTKAEHRLFLRGLQVFSRGNWKNISKFCVTTRTPLQVSSHAQKYFRRLENAANRQRYSINDVGLYDNEPLAQNNTSGREGFTFTHGANNPNRYGASGQHAILNNLAQVQRPILNHAYQANSSHANAWPGNQQLGATSSSSTHVMEGVGGSQATWASDQLGDFFPDQMINLDIF